MLQDNLNKSDLIKLESKKNNRLWKFFIRYHKIKRMR